MQNRQENQSLEEIQNPKQMIEEINNGLDLISKDSTGINACMRFCELEPEKRAFIFKEITNKNLFLKSIRKTLLENFFLLDEKLIAKIKAVYFECAAKSSLQELIMAHLEFPNSLNSNPNNNNFNLLSLFEYEKFSYEDKKTLLVAIQQQDIVRLNKYITSLQTYLNNLMQRPDQFRVSGGECTTLFGCLGICAYLAVTIFLSVKGGIQDAKYVKQPYNTTVCVDKFGGNPIDYKYGCGNDHISPYSIAAIIFGILGAVVLICICIQGCSSTKDIIKIENSISKNDWNFLLEDLNGLIDQLEYLSKLDAKQPATNSIKETNEIELGEIKPDLKKQGLIKHYQPTTKTVIDDLKNSQKILKRNKLPSRVLKNTISNLATTVKTIKSNVIESGQSISLFQPKTCKNDSIITIPNDRIMELPKEVSKHNN